MKTIKVRLKNPNLKYLESASRSVSYIWNYCNNISYKAIRDNNKFLSGFDLQKLTSGSSKELGLLSCSIQETCEEFALRRKQFKKRKLRWRTKKSLGWIPFKNNGITFKNGEIIYNKRAFKTFQPERLVGIDKAAGSFVQDSKGNWFVCLSVKEHQTTTIVAGEVGIDLGVKVTATLSNGSKVDNRRYFKQLQTKLAKAQRHNKKKQVKNIHTKIKNSRADYLHKESTKIVKENQLIVVGDLKLKKINKTKLAKPSLDSGVGMFRSMLEYKARTHQRKFVIVNENNTTRTCSICGIIPSSSPKGVKGLKVREWSCSCGAKHDRDVNAARNILRLGHQSLI